MSDTDPSPADRMKLNAKKVLRAVGPGHLRTRLGSPNAGSLFQLGCFSGFSGSRFLSVGVCCCCYSLLV